MTSANSARERPLEDFSFTDLQSIAETMDPESPALMLIRQELERRRSPQAEALLKKLSDKTSNSTSPQISRDLKPPQEASGGKAENPGDFIEKFLGVRALDQPSGKPLYRYHAEFRELDELQPILSDALGGRRIAPKTAMAFCLWAAEWWRRNHSGGRWKWEPLLLALDRPEFAPGNGRYLELQRMITRGLKAWDRDILKVGESRGFLVTLACEGGLPLLLVLKEHTHLRAFFKVVLEEFRLFGGTGVSPGELAERARDRLPKSLQQEVVFQLSGDLIRKIWEFQRELGETLTPVKDLDATHPGWRDELPVRVTDQVIRTLLNNLLLDAVEVARGGKIKVRWNLRLLPQGDEDWALEGTFHLPGALSEEDLRTLFGLHRSQSFPGRSTLFVQVAGHSPKPIAIVNRRKTEGSEGHFGVELLPAARVTEREDLNESRILVAKSQKEEHSTDLFPGASGLSDLPWIFLPADPEGPPRQEFQLAGQGSLKVREPWVVIAVPNDWELDPGSAAAATLMGRLESHERLLFRIEGEVDFLSEDGFRTSFQTNATRGQSRVEYRLSGKSRTIGWNPGEIYLGPPHLVQQEEGGFKSRVRLADLQWKPDVPTGLWVSYGTGAVGSGRLRYVKNGAVHHSARVRIVPESSEVHFRPGPDEGHGEIDFVGFGAQRICLIGTPEVTGGVTEEHDSHRLQLATEGPVPEAIQAVCDWGPRGRLILDLPFPATRVGFVQPNGIRLENESRAAVGMLAGIRGEAVVPFETEFQLHGELSGKGAARIPRNHRVITHPVRSLGGGHHALDLAEIQPLIQECLSLGEDQDAAVKLSMSSNDVGGSLPPRRVFVKRFDLELECREKHPPVLGLDHQSLLQADPADIQEIELEALSLLTPDQDPILLERLGNSSWRIPEEVMPSGPYLVLGRQGGWYRVRPMPWYVIDPQEGLGPRDRRPTTLSSMYRQGLPGPHEDTLFVSIARHMARDFGHPDWPTVFSYLKITSLPIHTFGLLRAITHSPRSASMAAIFSERADFQLLWNRLEVLPFAWWQVPFSAWREGFQVFADRLKNMLHALEDESREKELLHDQVDSRIERITDLLPGMKPAFGFMRGTVLGLQISGKSARIMNPQLQELLREEWSEHRRSCPCLQMGPNAIPSLPKLHDEVRSIQARNPWTKNVFVDRVGPFQEGARGDYADAPAISAVFALKDLRPSKELARQIRVVRMEDPEWFDESLCLCQLIAFGAMKSTLRDENLHG